LGSGGKRVTTRPPYLPLRLSSAMTVRRKFGAGAAGALARGGAAGVGASFIDVLFMNKTGRTSILTGTRGRRPGRILGSAREGPETRAR
jgi:hypothetical protein